MPAFLRTMACKVFCPQPPEAALRLPKRRNNSLRGAMFSQPLYPVPLAVPLSALPGPGGRGHLPLNLLGSPGRDSTRPWRLPAYPGAQAVCATSMIFGERCWPSLGKWGAWVRGGTFFLPLLFKLAGSCCHILIFRSHIQCRARPSGRSPFEFSISVIPISRPRPPHCVSSAHSLLMPSSAKVAPRQGGEDGTLSWLTGIALMNGHQIPRFCFH